LNCPGSERGQLIYNPALLLEKHQDEIAALEALNTGKPFLAAKETDLGLAIGTLKYYAGWAGKVSGKTIEVSGRGWILISPSPLTNQQSSPAKFAYTRVEPVGVVGQIVPWNFPRKSR